MHLPHFSIRGALAFGAGSLACLLFIYFNHHFIGLTLSGIIAGVALAWNRSGFLSTLLAGVGFGLGFLIGGVLMFGSLAMLALNQEYIYYEDLFLGFYLMFILAFVIIGAIGSAIWNLRSPAIGMVIGAKLFAVGGIAGSTLLIILLLVKALSIALMGVGVVIAYTISGGLYAAEAGRLREENVRMELKELKLE